MKLPALGFLAPLVMSLVAPQPASGENFDGKWRAQCGRDAVTERVSCAVLSAKLIPETRSNFVQVLVSVLPDDSHAILVRPNEGQAARCILRVDQNQDFHSESVLGGACLISDADGVLIEQFKSGASLLIRVRSRDGSHDEVRFSLDGFADAMRGADR